MVRSRGRGSSYQIVLNTILLPYHCFNITLRTKKDTSKNEKVFFHETDPSPASARVSLFAAYYIFPSLHRFLIFLDFLSSFSHPCACLHPEHLSTRVERCRLS